MRINNSVSAVIPTRNRPQLVLRALQSALVQTCKHLVEVVVVIDGPDIATSDALAVVKDPRLRVMVLPQNQGGQAARNAGIEAAQGQWIALLDDDDEWLPEKIELQMAVALKSRFRYPIVSCQFFSRTREYDLIWPRRQPYEPLSEYLLARDSFSMGEGVLNTITLLFPKDLFLQQPFTPNLKRCQEVDWVLRATTQAGVGIEFIARPLAILHLAEERTSITAVPRWRESLEWADGVRGMITARAYASYLSITVASQAARQGDWSAIGKLLRLIIFHGRPKIRDLAFFFAAWFVPRKIQLAVRKAGL